MTPIFTPTGQLIRPATPKPPVRTMYGESVLDRAEKHAFWRTLRLAEPLGVLLAVAALLYEWNTRQESRTVEAWQLLTTRAPGNSGKKEALEYLNGPQWFGIFGSRRASLRGVDLSPPSDSGPGAFLPGVDLSGADLRGAKLDNSEMTGADFTSADLGSTSLRGVDARNASFVGANLAGSDWLGSNVFRARFDQSTTKRVSPAGDRRKAPAPDSYISIGSIYSDERSDRNSINANGVVFSEVSFVDTDIEITGEDIVFEAADVSGASIAFRGLAGNRPIGYVWARSHTPAVRLPKTLMYFECPAGAGLPFHRNALVALEALIDDITPHSDYRKGRFIVEANGCERIMEFDSGDDLTIEELVTKIKEEVERVRKNMEPIRPEGGVPP